MVDSVQLPAYTVGSLQQQAQMETWLEFIESLLQQNQIGEKLKEWGDQIPNYLHSDIPKSI